MLPNPPRPHSLLFTILLLLELSCRSIHSFNINGTGRFLNASTPFKSLINVNSTGSIAPNRTIVFNTLSSVAIIVNKSTSMSSSSHLPSNKRGKEYQMYLGCYQAMNFNSSRCVVWNLDSNNATQISSKLLSNSNVGLVVFAIEFQNISDVIATDTRFKNVSFALIDRNSSVPMPRNVKIISFVEAEMGFVAGVVAGHVANQEWENGYSHYPGALVVSGIPRLEEKLFSNGFKNGAVFACPQCSIFRIILDSDTDTAAANNALDDFYNNYVWEATAAAHSGGAAQAAALLEFATNIDSGKYVPYYGYTIGFGVEELYTTYTADRGYYQYYYFTSIIKNYTVVSRTIINSYTSGVYDKNTSSQLGFKSGAISIPSCDDNNINCWLWELQDYWNVTDKYGCSVPTLNTEWEFATNVMSLLTDSPVYDKVNSSTGDLFELQPQNFKDNTFNSSIPFGYVPFSMFNHTLTSDSVGNLYIFGGTKQLWTWVDTTNYTYWNDTNSTTGTWNSTFISMSRIYKFDLNYNEVQEIWNSGWTSSVIYPEARHSHSAIYYNTSLYITGGMNDTDPLNPVVFGDLYSVDLSYDHVDTGFNLTYLPTWTKIPIVNHQNYLRRAGASSMSSGNNFLYLYGGIAINDLTDGQFVFRNDLIRLNLDTQKIDVLAPAGDLPPPLAYAATAQFNSTHAFIYGGRDENFLALGSLYCLDLVRLKWKLIKGIGGVAVSPPPTVQSGLVRLDSNRLLLFGGSNGDGSVLYDFAVVYNVVNNIWEYQDTNPLPQPMAGFGAAVYRQNTTTACLYKNTNYRLCPIEERPVLYVFGGMGNYQTPVPPSLISFRIGNATDPTIECGRGEELQYSSYKKAFECVECPPNYYKTYGYNGTCQPCPDGGICDEGGDMVKVQSKKWQDKATYFMNSTLSVKIYSCETGTCCSSEEGCAIDEICVNGTTGRLCSSCSEKDFYLWGEECVYCPKNNVKYFFVVFGVSFMAVLLVVFVTGHNGYISEMIFSYQIMAQTLNGGVYESVLKIITSLNPAITITIIIQYATDKCIGPFAGQAKSILYLLCSILMAAQFGFIYMFAWVWQRALKHRKVGWVSRIHEKFPKKIREMTMADFKGVGIQMTLFLYEPMFDSALSMFNCIQLVENGQLVSVLKEYPDVVCYQGNHITSIIIAIFIMVVLMVVIPAWILGELLKHKRERAKIGITKQQHCSHHSLDAPPSNPEDGGGDGGGHTVDEADKELKKSKSLQERILLRHAERRKLVRTITGHFKPKYWFWLLVEFAERCSISFNAVFTSNLDDVYRAYYIFFNVLIMLMLQRFNYYQHPIDNWCKMIFILCMLGICGLAMIRGALCGGNVACTETDIPQFKSFSVWQGLFIVFPLVLWAYRVLRSSRRRIRSAYRYVYAKLHGLDFHDDSSEHGHHHHPSSHHQQHKFHGSHINLGGVATPMMSRLDLSNHLGDRRPSLSVVDAEVMAARENNERHRGVERPMNGSQPILNSDHCRDSNVSGHSGGGSSSVAAHGSQAALGESDDDLAAH